MTDDRHGHARDGPTADRGRRDFLRGAAASVAGLTALGAAGGSASAANRNHLLVVGNGAGEHTYEIQMASGGRISRATHAGGNDTETTNGAGDDRIEGTVWHWNLDSYAYTGSIDHVAGDGSLSFHFLDGAFRDAFELAVNGKGSGRHDYAIGVNRGDIDPQPGSTESGDTDEGPSQSEYHYSTDHISGIAWNRGTDEYSLGYDDPVQHVRIDDGHLEIREPRLRFTFPGVDL